MVIDSSALLAILLGEPDREPLKRAINSSSIRLVSATTKLEASMVVIGRLGDAMRLDQLLDSIGAVIVPFDDHHATIAREAFARYGKGRHKAALNFSDCAAYALAMAEAEPLLFKGTNFGATDVEVVALQ